MTVLSPLQVQASLYVTNERGTLTIQARDITAEQLAVTLSQKLGIPVIIAGNTQERFTFDIVNEPLDKALAKLAPSHMLVRDDRIDSSDNIVELVLMMEEGVGATQGDIADFSRFLPSGASEIVEPIPETETEIASASSAVDPATALPPSEDVAAQIRAVIEAASSNPDLPAAQMPPMFAKDY